MGSKAFLVMDPHDIEVTMLPDDMRRYDYYCRKEGDRYRKTNQEVRRNIEMLRRALQILPPRELDMIFATKVNLGIQDKIRERFSVQQSNISYRLAQSWKRIKLYIRISEMMSETRLRTLLFQAQIPNLSVQIVLGFVKTENQSVTARSLGLTQGKARGLFLLTLKAIQETTKLRPKDKTKLLELLNLINENFNRLRAPQSQERWSWKVGDSNYTSVVKFLSSEGDQESIFDSI